MSKDNGGPASDKFQQARRDAFEAAYLKQFGRYPDNWCHVISKYLNAHAQGAWLAWFAALDAVEIELPESCRQVTIDDESIDIYWPNEVRAAIESTKLGIKVKLIRQPQTH